MSDAGRPPGIARNATVVGAGDHRVVRAVWHRGDQEGTGEVDETRAAGGTPWKAPSQGDI
ncbi:MAG TPA: hypothetical protein VG184_12435 [Acidimicrobiales bacterium]|nr:hypothetical protein [Acidimicrobiales bacterium]